VGDVHDLLVITALDKNYKDGWNATLQELSKDVIYKHVLADQWLAEIVFEDAIEKAGADNHHVIKAQKHYDKAFEYMAEGRYDKAIDEFKKMWKDSLKARAKWVPESFENTLAEIIVELQELQEEGNISAKALGYLEKAEEELYSALEESCKGVRSLTLEYSGGPGADITVNEGIVTDNGDGTYTITPEVGKDKLSSNTKIYVDDVLETQIHTSCSKPLDVGDVHDSFLVVGLDKIITSYDNLGKSLDHIKKAIDELEKAMDEDENATTTDIIDSLMENIEDTVYEKITDAEIQAGAGNSDVVKAWEKFDAALAILDEDEIDYKKAVDLFKEAVKKAEKAFK
jgi:tetratricopeptide (TPR) repeat protein